MSLTIGSATADASRATYPMPQGVGAVVGAIKPTWAQADGVDHMLFDIDDGSGANGFFLQKYLDNSLYAGWITGGVDYRITVTTANYTLLQNQWNYFIFDYDNAGPVQHLYLNGTQLGIRAGSFTTVDVSTQTLHIGNSRAGSEDARGDLWHWGVYTRVPVASERVAFGAGGIPSNPFSFWRLDNSGVDLTAAARNLTLTNTTFGTSPATGRSGASIFLPTMLDAA